MDNRLTWLEPDCWTKGASARNKEGVEVPYFHRDAHYFDLYGAVKNSYSEGEVDKVVAKLKEVIHYLYPDKYKEASDKVYYKSKGKLINVTPLYLINDCFEDFEQIRRILFYF